MSVWGPKTLGDLERESGGTIQTGPFGSQLHMSDYSDTGTPVVMPTNIRDLRIDRTGIARVKDEHVERLARHKLRVGDIVYSRRGDVEKCALITENEEGWLCGTGCLLVRVQGSNLDARFLSYLLSRPETRAWISQHAVGATMPNLNTEILREVPVDVPDIKTQHTIAATLGALDDKIKSNRRAIELMVELVRARFAGDFDVDQADDGVAIGEIVDINSRRKLARGEEAIYVSMSSLPEFSPAVLEWEKRAFGSGQKFVNGDVLMARITPCLENGKTAVVDMLDDGEVGWGSTEYVVLSPRGAFSTPWIYALTRHETIRDWAIGRMTGTSGRQRFQASGFHEYRIQEPDPAVLAAFNDFAVPMFCKVSQARDEIKILEQLRDALLPELFSGRISVPNEGAVA